MHRDVIAPEEQLSVVGVQADLLEEDQVRNEVVQLNEPGHARRKARPRRVAITGLLLDQNSSAAILLAPRKLLRGWFRQALCRSNPGDVLSRDGNTALNIRSCVACGNRPMWLRQPVPEPEVRFLDFVSSEPKP